MQYQLDEVKNPAEGVPPHKLKFMTMYASNFHFREAVDDYVDIFNKYDSLNLELASVTASIARLQHPDLQSSEEGLLSGGTVDSTVMEHHETVTEIGGSETHRVDVGGSPITYIKSDPDLNAFFKRPIQIGTFSMAAGASVENTYKVCDLYLMDPAVRAKLRNFAFLRGKFKVRISVSGTPFDYGRLICAAWPWAQINEVYTTLFAGGATWDLLKLQYMSQAKTSVVIDVKENKPIDIELPWVSSTPVGRLYNVATTAVGSATSFDDFTNMWTLIIKSLNVLKSISASPSPVYVYLYAFMEDVEIGVPTASQLAVVTQSDERKTGPVQGIATNLLSVSKRLETVPYIGVYAKASSFVLDGVKSVASLFGWSAPVMITPPSRMKNEPYQNGANLIQYDTGQRITLDPKQELAISTEYVSVASDELVIADLCKIRSYLTNFQWLAATAPLSSMYAVAIHPRLCVGYTGSPSGVKNVLPTPMHQIAQMFTKWRGRIVITLEAVCSSFHRGKLLITYDPNVMQYALIVANTNLNKQYTHIWDIQETQKYSICVDWNMVRQWAANLPDTVVYNLLSGATIVPAATWFDAVNGFLNIAPFTKLQSPDGSDITINVYVHGEDMQFNRLDAQFMPLNRTVQYNMESVDTSSVKELSSSDMSCITINPSSVSEKGADEHFYGESPISLRSLFKRFIATTTASIATGVIPGLTFLTGSWPIIPAVSPAMGGSVSNAYFVSPLNHMRYAFLAIRGGMRKRLNFFLNNSINYAPLVVSLVSDDVTTASSIAVANGSSNSFRDASMVMGGSAKFVPSTNGGFEFEIPYYNPNYYSWSCNSNPHISAATSSTSTMSRSYSYSANLGASAASYTLYVVEENATAEDFQLAYFLGCVPYVST